MQQGEYLLAFSCKGRWFCPSKKVVQFGDVLHETILYPVPHRHYVFSIPIMLRIYFKHNRAYWIKQNAYLAKILETKPTTFNEIKRGINSILEFASTSALSKNDKLADGYFKIK